MPVRLIAAHDPLRAAEQGERRRARIAGLEAMAGKMAGKLDARGLSPDRAAPNPPGEGLGPDGKTAKGRRASDRGAYSRFARAVAEAGLTRFLEADLNAERFSWSIDEGAIAEAGLFDGKRAPITTARDLSPTEAVAQRPRRHRARLPRAELRHRARAGSSSTPPSRDIAAQCPAGQWIRIRAHAMICFLALVLHRVMRMRLKAKGHSASPRTALDRLVRIQQHVARIGPATKTTLTRQQPEQLDLSEALSLKTPT